MIIALSEDDLYDITDLSLEDCETLVNYFKKFGLVIIKQKYLDILIKEEDDLK